jgi:hypothetical protein
MHTKFELNWMEAVAREIHKVSPRILKQETNLNSGTYKPYLGNVNFPNPSRWGKMDVEFFLCNFKKILISSSCQKVTAVLPNHL